MTADEHWRRFRASGDPAALGAVFDAVSPELFRIALSLAPDAASAEDALQETWLVALRSAARHDPARPVVPWLAGILRNKVHEARRRGRRPDERRVARRAPPDDPALAAQSSDEIARLRTAIDALPASQRAVAVLRWRYGLEPAEIADARGLPPGTVRSLLHRALARIRRRMKAAPALLALGAPWPRGLEDVRAVVLRAARRRSLLDATLASAGGVVMAKATKTAVIAAVACLLLGAGAAVRLAGRHAPTQASAPAEESPTASHPSPRIRADAPGDAPTAPAADDAKPFARGIVVDEAGAPISGCRVLVRGHATHGDVDVQEEPTRIAGPAVATTDVHGRFVVPRRPDDLAALVFAAEGFAISEVRDATDDLRIVLPRCEPFAGRVEDTAARPIEGADIRIAAPLMRGDTAVRDWLRASTGPDGRFEFRSTPREYVLSWVGAKGYAPAPGMFGSIEPREVYVLRRSSIVANVSDAEAGRPVTTSRGLLLREGQPPWPDWRWPASAGADRDDQPARLVWHPHPEGHGVMGRITVSAPGYRSRTLPLSFADDTEPPQLDVALERGDEPPAVAGHVADGGGALVELRTATTTADGRPIGYGSDLQLPVAGSAVAAPDGSFAIAGVPPGRYRLVVTRDGDPPLLLDVEVPATSLDLRFPQKAALAVRYVDTAGRPVAGAWIHVQTADEHLGWDMKTDAEGIARFAALPAGEVLVLPVLRGVVQIAGFGPDALGPIPSASRTLAAGTEERVDLVAPDRCRVTVVVRDDGDRPVAGAEIHVATEGGLAQFDREEQRRLQSLDIATDAEGRAMFEVLPCRCVVKALRQGRIDSERIRVEIGSSPTVELVLPTAVGRIVGRALERGSGAPLAGRPVKAWCGGKLVAESATGDDGRFALGGIPAGHVQVGVAGGTDANDPMGRHVDPKSPYGWADVEFEMTAGEDRSVALTLPRIKGNEAERTAAVVEATIVDAAGAPVAGVHASVRGLIDGTWCSLGGAEAGDDGRARMEVVAAERYRVRAWSGDRSVEVEREAAPAISERLVLALK